MTNEVRDHFHLWAVGDTFASNTDYEYNILLGGLKDIPTAIVSHVRALNASSHPHVLVDEYGNPILIKDVMLKVVASLAQRATLAAIQGKQCYYLPICHMDVGDTHATANVAESPGYLVFMMPMADDAMLDPLGEYWIVSLTLKDDSF